MSSPVIARAFAIKNRDPTVRRDPVGRCIYCDAINYRPGSSRKLAEEHVIAEGLGGTLVLQEATCEKCERLVNIFEQTILKTILHLPRMHLGVRRKRRKRNTETVKVMGKVNDQDVEVVLPIKEAPPILFLTKLSPPGLLVGRPADVQDFRGVWVKWFSPQLLPLQRLQSFATHVLDTFKFSQFLAKMAHGFAVDQLGQDGFTPLLRGIICAPVNSPNYEFVGGKSHDALPSPNLHELELEIVRANALDYLVANIRLFANLGAPAYAVVVGYPKAMGSNSAR